MKNLIMGAFYGYDYSKIKYWVNSIKMTDFDGDIVVFAFETDQETINKLIEKGVTVIVGQKSQMPIHTERFIHFYDFLFKHQGDYDRVLITDMKDVILQSDPFTYYNDPSVFLMYGTECLRYKDEPWGRQNYLETFGPYFYEQIKDKEIYNVGVLYGQYRPMMDLCLMIFQMSLNRPIPIVDQAVFNMIIQNTDQNFSEFLRMDSGWVCHLGTVADPSKIEQFRPFLTEKEPVIEYDSKYEKMTVKTHDGKPFVIVHQYDRVPMLKQNFENIYGEE